MSGGDVPFIEHHTRVHAHTPRHATTHATSHHSPVTHPSTQGDIYSDADAAIAGADVVFCYATCLEVDEAGTLAKLTEALARSARPECCVITVNRPLSAGMGFRQVGALRGPNPESADGMLSTAYISTFEGCAGAGGSGADGDAGGGGS